MKLIKKLIFFIIIVILVGCGLVGGYLTYVNSNSQAAKDYLLDKYEINEKDWMAVKYTEYVYEDIANCETLWLKKCTEDENLLYAYTFKNKMSETIIVKEDKNNKFSDNYNGILKEKDENSNNPPNDTDTLS